ncbi:hypothetical protein, partial [Pseudomonas syringae group genomosp. 7]|uniref:hypothetical protein n=1 Tax=Pseudomonas syringae group genomosp. 7 TaxID=251699 RepID=UPI00376F7219
MVFLVGGVFGWCVSVWLAGVGFLVFVGVEGVLVGFGFLRFWGWVVGCCLVWLCCCCWWFCGVGCVCCGVCFGIFCWWGCGGLGGGVGWRRCRH